MNTEKKPKPGQVTPPGADQDPAAGVAAAAGGGGQGTSKLKEYLRGRKSDLDVDDDDAVHGYLSGELDRLDKSDETNRRMNELISQDGRSAGLITGFLSGKGEDGEDFDLAGYIMQNWFDEIRESATPEEAARRVNEKMANEEKAAAEQAKRDKSIEENFAKMSDALGAAMKRVGADGKTAQEAMDWLFGTDEQEGLILRIPKRTLSEDDFVKILYAFGRDAELEKSRNEGRSEGRRTRPGATHRSAAPDNTDLGGGGGGIETEPEEENTTARRYGGMRPRFA